MYKQFILVALVATSPAFSGESFEINKRNCNLPIKEIKKHIPDDSERQTVLEKCMEKASEENWMKKSLVAG